MTLNLLRKEGKEGFRMSMEPTLLKEGFQVLCDPKLLEEKKGLGWLLSLIFSGSVSMLEEGTFGMLRDPA